HDAVVARLAGVEDKGCAEGDQPLRNRRDTVAADANINDGGIEAFRLGASERFFDRAAGVHALSTCVAQEIFKVEQEQGIILDNEHAHASQSAFATGIRRVPHALAPFIASLRRSRDRRDNPPASRPLGPRWYWQSGQYCRCG